MFRDPADNLLLARRLAAISIGCTEEELPEGDYEISHDSDGHVVVLAAVRPKGHVSSITCNVSLEDPNAKTPPLR